MTVVIASRTRLMLRPCCQRGLESSVTKGAQKRWQAATGSNNTNQKPPEPLDAPKSFLIGSFAGCLGSLAGMGGGFVMIPLMTSSLLKLSQHQAHGTSLFAVAATGVAGALGYSGQADVTAATAIATCGMVSAKFGAEAITKLSEKTLQRYLGIFMLLVAPLVPAKALLVQEKEQEQKINKNDDKDDSYLIQHIMIPAAIGCGSGYLAGLFGVGGGAIVVPALTVFTDMTHYQALGTSLCAMSLPAVVGTFTHYQKGNVALRVAPTLAAGAFCGAYVGSKFVGLHTDEMTLRWGFSGLMTVLGIKTLMRA